MAATDPTRSIRQYEHPSAFDLSASDLLNRLSDLPPSIDVPYLTITIDWRVQGGQPGRQEDIDVKRSQTRNVDNDGGSGRPALRQVEQEINRLIDAQGPRGDVLDSLTADRGNVLEWIRTQLDPSAQGVYIVANAKHGVFEATGLALPLETRVALSPTPRIYQLVRLIEDNPTYGVLVVDQGEAELSFITHGSREHSVTLTSSLYPRRTQQGAFNQRRYQNRADERVEAFARDICDQTSRALHDAGVDILVLAGSTVMMSAVEKEMSADLSSKLVDRIRTETPLDEHAKINLTLPVADRAERDAEAAVVSKLADRIGTDGRGATGVADTLRALQNGQVDELVMLDTFREPGWADYSMSVFGVGEIPAEHPIGGDIANVHAIELRNEMIRLALGSKAKVDIVHSEVAADAIESVGSGGERPRTKAAVQLDDMGGVGAVLRYTMMDGDAPAPNV